MMLTAGEVINVHYLLTYTGLCGIYTFKSLYVLYTVYHGDIQDSGENAVGLITLYIIDL